MNLYNISDKYLAVLSNVNEYGELEESSLLELDKIEDELENKAVAISSYIKNLEGHQNAIKKAVDDMNDRGFVIQRKIEAIRKYLLTNMERTGISKINSPYFDITLKKNPCSVVIEDEAILSDDYKKAKVQLSIDKIKIRDDLKNGIEVKGAKLIQSNRIEIK